MKFYKESIVALLLLAILYSRPMFLSEMVDSSLGKLAIIVAIILVGHNYGKYHSIGLAVVALVLLHQSVEGLENKNDAKESKDEDESEEEDVDEMEKDESPAKEHDDEELENVSGSDQIDSEETLKAVVPSDAPQNENDVVEGFMNFNFSKCSSCGI